MSSVAPMPRTGEPRFGRQPSRYRKDDITFSKHPSPTEIWDLEEICTAGSLKRLVKLLDGWMNIGVKDPPKMNVGLRVAAKYARAQLVKYLLTKGADPNEKDETGRTSLHYAAASGCIKCTRYLLEHGADKLIKCNAGVLAQELASSTGAHSISLSINSFVSPWDMIIERERRRKEEQELFLRELEDRKQRNDDGLELLESVLAQKEALFGDQHVGLVPTLEKLAVEYLGQNNARAAVDAQNRATRIACKKLLSVPKNVDRACICCARLGELYMKVREFELAEASLRKSIDYLKAYHTITRKEEHQKDIIPFSVKSCNPHLSRERRLLQAIAQCLGAQNKHELEIETWRQIIDIIQVETGDDQNPLLAYPLMALGRAHTCLGNHKSAQTDLALGLAITDKHLGPVHADIAVCLDNLAYCFYNQHEYTRAEALFRRSLKIRELVLDPEKDQSVLRTTQNNIAMSIISRNKFGVASRTQRRKRSSRQPRKSSALSAIGSIKVAGR